MAQPLEVRLIRYATAVPTSSRVTESGSRARPRAVDKTLVRASPMPKMTSPWN
ncbi:Uncharacterised protein [Mycobacteroides abscessus subsp. abscessus]|nr:Uncharacterised protein [Mycobacteroides abscessus subsp. abscessus]